MVDEELPVNGAARHAVQLREGGVIHAVFHEQRHVARGGIMAGGVQPVRIDKMRVRHTESLGLGVHERGKARCRPQYARRAQSAASFQDTKAAP